MRPGNARRMYAGGFMAVAIVLAVASVAAACTSYAGKVTVAAVPTALGGSGSHTVEGSGETELHGYCVSNAVTDVAPIGAMTIKGLFTLKIDPGTSGGYCNTGPVTKLPANLVDGYVVRYAIVGTTSTESWCNPNSTLGHLGTIRVNSDGYSIADTDTSSPGTPAAKQFTLPPTQGRVAFCVIWPTPEPTSTNAFKNGSYSAPELRADVNVI